jgi:hypothetical protein
MYSTRTVVSIVHGLTLTFKIVLADARAFACTLTQRYTSTLSLREVLYV